MPRCMPTPSASTYGRRVLFHTSTPSDASTAIVP